jgi:hypothetical protein
VISKNDDSSKLTEEELVEFWNSHYFEKENNKIENKIVLPKNKNDLQKIVFDVEQEIANERLSNAYNVAKYLLSQISETMMSKKETMKVVINDGYGGFYLSEEALHMFAKLKGKNPSEINIYHSNFKRHDEDLVKVVEYLGDKASGICSELKIVEIPNGIKYKINDYDGWETVSY